MKKFSTKFCVTPYGKYDVSKDKFYNETKLHYESKLRDEYKRQADQSLGELITKNLHYDLVDRNEHLLTFIKEVYCLTHLEVVELGYNIKLLELSLGSDNPILKQIKNILKVE